MVSSNSKCCLLFLHQFLLYFCVFHTGLFPFDADGVNYNRSAQHESHSASNIATTDAGESLRCDANCKFFPNTTPLSVFETILIDNTSADLVADFRTAVDNGVEYEHTEYKVLFNIWKQYKTQFQSKPTEIGNSSLENNLPNEFHIEDTRIDFIDHFMPTDVGNLSLMLSLGAEETIFNVLNESLSIVDYDEEIVQSAALSTTDYADTELTDLEQLSHPGATASYTSDSSALNIKKRKLTPLIGDTPAIEMGSNILRENQIEPDIEKRFERTQLLNTKCSASAKKRVASSAISTKEDKRYRLENRERESKEIEIENINRVFSYSSICKKNIQIDHNYSTSS